MAARGVAGRSRCGIYGLTDKLVNLSGLFGSGGPGAYRRGSPGTDRFRVMAAAARTLGLNLLDISPESLKAAPKTPWLGTLATLTASLPVFQVDAFPGETIRSRAIKGYAGPIGVVSGMFGDRAGGPRSERLQRGRRSWLAMR